MQIHTLTVWYKGGGEGGDGTPVQCAISTQDRAQEGESVLSFTHEQNTISSQIQSRPILRTPVLTDLGMRA